MPNNRSRSYSTGSGRPEPYRTNYTISQLRSSQNNQNNRTSNHQPHNQNNQTNQLPPNNYQQPPNNNQNANKNDKDKILDCDVFIGHFPYLVTHEDLILAKKVLRSPNQMHLTRSTTNTFANDNIGENRRCRNLIVGLDPAWYKRGGAEAALFKNDTNEISAKTKKFFDAITKMTTDVAAAVAHHKPRLIFIEIVRREGAEKSDFDAAIQFMCQKNDYIPMNIDPPTQTPTFELPEKERIKNYTKSLKFYFKTYFAPKAIKIADLEQTNGINVNEL